MKIPVIIMTFILSYLVVAFLTFGSVYNSYNCGLQVDIEEDLNRWYTWSSCDADMTKYRDNSAAMAAVLWPIYWAGKAAIEVTK